MRLLRHTSERRARVCGRCGPPCKWCNGTGGVYAHLSQVPGTDCVVQAPRPELSAIARDVNAASTVRVALELPAGGQKDRTKWLH